MSIRRCLVSGAVVSLLGFQNIPLVAQRTVISQDDRERIIRLYRASQQNFIGELSDPDRDWFAKFLKSDRNFMSEPGAVLAWCVKSVKFKYLPATTIHITLANWAYQIENPSKVGDVEAIQQGCLESFLRAYQKALLVSPDIRNPEFDRAIKYLNEGRLGFFIQELRSKIRR